MKLQFKGWKREVTVHDHSVSPVTYSSERGEYSAGEPDDPLKWTSSSQAFGQVKDIALNGTFLIEFTFEQEELRNWLRQFVSSKPEAAIKLLSEMQGEALLSLMRKTEERIAQKER
ncbi:MAG: hypothetical protein WD065_08075 [Planctomycetaceae bacterium]